MIDKKKHTTVSSNSEEVDLRKILGIFLDGKWSILIFILIFSILGCAYAMLATPIYKADTLIQIEQKSSGGFSAVVSENLGDAFSSESSADVEIQLIKSRMILGSTIKKYNLTTLVKPDYFPIIGKGISRLIGNEQSIKISKFDINNSLLGNKYTIEVKDEAIGSYSVIDENGLTLLTGKVGETLSGNGIVVNVRDIKADNGFKFNIEKIGYISAINWLKDKLTVQEQGSKTGIILLSLELENANEARELLDDISKRYFLQNVERNSAEAEQSIKFLNEKIPAIKETLIDSENKLNQYRKKRESVDLTMEAESTLKVMVNLESQLNGLTFKEAEISKKYTKDHPAYRALLDKRKTLLEQKEKINSKIATLPETQKEILSLKRDVEVNQQIYVQLLNKIQELNVVKAGTVGNVRIIDPAQSYPDPVKPLKMITVLASVIVGFMFSVLYLFLKMVLHKGIENPDQLEEIGLSVYANIPKSELQISLVERIGKHKKLKQRKILAEINPADLSIEAFRGLRTSLHFAMMEARNNILMISGPAPGVGKSFVSTNFAAVYAQTGHKVLLIDADMRKGYLHTSMALSQKNGLSDYLSGNVELLNCIKASSIENLDVITRGQVPPNPSELLMHTRMSDLLKYAENSYDLVIVDTPPILAVTDASIVGAHVGTTLLVTRFGVNTVKEVEVACSRFEQSGVLVKGVILNATEKKASSYYGYGYYNYSYKSDS
ncbi:polysaccharide biosynthesis tyrosine autokinase [Vibrio tritonius]|uniref:Polysaccharide biosynthesis tyrosine autokinase n=1 Tax=Vibrio tritonius TaxID=1435069 RepID=A0ABS7YKB0_9VIBR|nr:polysaccharide biosynthesis tyrosine autokinase [Vibrio tritonius]MCA2016112.1 polysaccharide biosynthesis tyrosine autokinase [Vibrio tritonius]